MKTNRKLNKTQTVEADILPLIPIAMVASALIGAGTSVYNSKQQENMQKQQAQRAQEERAMIQGRQYHDASIESYGGSLQAANSMLQQNYYQNNTTGVPSFKKGGYIATSTGEAANIVKPDGTTTTRRISGPGTKFSDSVLTDASNIESIGSNIKTPWGGSFADLNMDIDKYFKTNSKDRDWLSRNTDDRKEKSKQAVRATAMLLQNEAGKNMSFPREKEVKEGTPIHRFKKGGYVVPAAAIGASGYASMASSLSDFIPAIYNLIQGRKKPLHVDPVLTKRTHNPYEGTAMSLINNRRFDINPYINQIDKQTATANYNASNVGNTGAYRMLRLANDSAARDQYARLYSQKEATEGQYRGEAAQMISQLGARRAAIENYANNLDTASIAEARDINNNFIMSRQQQTATGVGQLASGFNKLANSVAGAYSNAQMKGPMDEYMKGFGKAWNEKKWSWEDIKAGDAGYVNPSLQGKQLENWNKFIAKNPIGSNAPVRLAGPNIPFKSINTSNPITPMAYNVYQDPVYLAQKNWLDSLYKK